MNSTSTTVYDGCEADVYLNDTETGFLSRFPVGERTCFQSRSISTFTYGDTVVHSISRRCYLLSYGELFNASPTPYGVYMRSSSVGIAGLPVSKTVSSAQESSPGTISVDSNGVISAFSSSSYPLRAGTYIVVCGW